MTAKLDEKRHEIQRESPYRLVSAALRTSTRPDRDLCSLLRGNPRKLACPLSTRRYRSINQRQTSHGSRLPKDRDLFRFHDRWKTLSVVFRRGDESGDQADGRDTRGQQNLY